MRSITKWGVEGQYGISMLIQPGRNGIFAAFMEKRERPAPTNRRFYYAWRVWIMNEAATYSVAVRSGLVVEHDTMSGLMHVLAETVPSQAAGILDAIAGMCVHKS